MANTFVYGLIDPRTLMIRYVGMTTTGMRRPKMHRRSSSLAFKSHKNSWLQGLISSGFQYEITVLEVVDVEAIKDAERWWISIGRAFGWPLTNMTDGGDGVLNPSTETRKKIGNGMRGRNHTAETRERMSRSAKGKIISIESRRRMSDSRRGKKRSDETRRRISASHVGIKPSASSREKMKASARARWSRPEQLEQQRQRMLGSSPSDETRAKLSAAATRQWRSQRG